jgi:NAD(P)-dependent dehydrogenase (short-subunit alcohol dehydrogenase family)
VWGGSIRSVAVIALAKNLADELAGTGITVATVHPGLTRTEKVDAMLTACAWKEGRSLGEAEAALAANMLI